MKRLFLFLLALGIYLSGMSATKINGLYYNLNSTNKTAEVTYYSFTSSSNKSYVSGDLKIPNQVTYDGKVYSVTSIGDKAFSGCSYLTSVEIPNSVTSIGNNAFSGCSGMISIDIPNSVTSIGEWAFYNCSGLTSIDIPNSVTSVGWAAFRDCIAIKELNIEDGETELFLEYSEKTSQSESKDGKGTFYDCPLETLYLGRNITYPTDSHSGYSPFAKIKTLKDVTIGNSVTSLYENAFYYCSNLKSVRIGNSVTSIGKLAFYNCTGLTSVEIPNSVTSIGHAAFNFCEKLTNITIPNSVTSIGDFAFSGCSGLTSIDIPNSVTSIGSRAFYACRGLTSVIIGNSVTSIGESAFYNCSGLTSIDIPNSVTSIGSSVFSGCTGLTSVEIGNSVTSIGDRAFYDCNSLTSIEIPNSVTSIRERAFYNCSRLTSLVIPNSVTSIRERAFYNCTAIKELKIEDGDLELSLGNYGFKNCPLETLYLGRNLTYNTNEENGYSPFYDIRTLKDVTISNSVTSIRERAFLSCKGLTSIVIPNSVTSIGYSAFANCWSLTSVEIGNSVTSIGSSAFQQCYDLASVKIGSSDTSIGDYAFLYTGLTNIILDIDSPPSYYSSFKGFINVATLTIPDTADIPAYLVSDWRNFLNIEQANGGKIFLENDGVFKYGFVESQGQAYLVSSPDYSTMVSASIPDRVVADRYGEESFYQVSGITANAFKNCSKLTQVKLPANCRTIGSSAFESCSGLTSIEIPNSVISIGSQAFFNCSGLTRVDIIDFEAWCKIDFANATANPLYYAKNLCLNNDIVTSLSIPASISEIKNYTFYNCKSISGNFLIPSTITSIGTDAFANIEFNDYLIEDGFKPLECKGKNNINAKTLYLGRTIQGPITFEGINSIKVSGFVESIPANCCKNNTALESLVINPGGAVVIGEGAFQGCSSLSDITLPEDIAEIGANAFSGTALKNVTVPNGIIERNAFANCNLDNIILGAGVESIGEKAFDGSNAINAVYATPTTPPAAENNTFSYYESQLYVPEEAIDTYYNFTRCWYRFRGKPLVLPESIHVSGPATIKGEKGETIQLSATITPSNVTLNRVLWHSTNPAIASVDNNGLVTIHNFTTDGSKAKAANPVSCQIIATTLYEDSPVAMVTIETDLKNAAIEYINSDNISGSGQQGTAPNDIFTLQGVCLKRNASQSDIDTLTPGIYIIAGKKVIVK